MVQVAATMPLLLLDILEYDKVEFVHLKKMT